MTTTGRWLLRSYGAAAFVLMSLGFAGLFSRKMGLRIPFVTTDLIPALHRHAVWGETLRGRTILVGGEAWFFLIVVGVVVLLGIFTAILNRLLQSSKKAAGK